MGSVVGIVLVVALINGGIGALIGSSKGKTSDGFWWGFFLGQIGWIIIAVSRSSAEQDARHLIHVEQERARMLGVPARYAAVPAQAAEVGQQAVLPAPAPTSTNPQCWAHDPFRRFPLRYWDGWRWTHRVADTTRHEAVDEITPELLTAAPRRACPLDQPHLTPAKRGSTSPPTRLNR
ncbi:MAG: hypothetical protein QM733_01970 [Ilumatobacteraceae bacterium]